MPTEIDKLQIEINAKATNANKAIDNLVVKLDALTSRLGKINGNNLVGLANGVNAFGNSVKTIGSIDSRKFERLATNITKISMLDTASINRASSAMHQLTRSLNSLGSVSQSAMQISQIASNVSKLGGVNVTRAITNLPLLTKELSKFMSVMAKSPQVSRNIIDMTNALANLSAQGRNVGAATNGLTNGLNKTNNVIRTTSKSTISLASAFGKFYATYFLVIRGIKGLLGSIEKTADYFEAFNYFNVAFNKIANEWKGDWEKYGEELGVATAEAYAESFTDRMEETFSKLSGIEFDIDKGLLSETGVKNLGLNIQKITQYASQLASVTNSLEFTGEASVATSQALVKLAGDISSLFNVDYDQVSSNLTSGLLGQSKALYKYGIDITQATLQTKAYELGLSKAVSEMIQGEKAQLRLLTILDASSVAWGDQANTINSLANQMRVLENTWSETSMIFGQLFVPMLENALPVINGLVIALRRLLIEIAGFMGVQIDPNKFNTGLSGTEDLLDGITDGLEDATEAAKEYENQLLGFDEINKLQEPKDIINVGVEDSNIDLTDQILKATEEYNKIWDEAYARMENRAQEWADKIYEYFKDSNWLNKGLDVSNIASGIYDTMSRAIESVDWNELGHNVGEFLAGIQWFDIIVSALKFKVNLAKAIVQAWTSSFTEAPIETALLTTLGVMKFTTFGNAMAMKLVNAVRMPLVEAWGGGKLVSDIFTAQSIGSVATGSFATIGLTIATSVISGIVAGFAGWNAGQFFAKHVLGEDFGVDKSFEEQVTYLQEALTGISTKDYVSPYFISEDIQAISNSIADLITNAEHLRNISTNGLLNAFGNVEDLEELKDKYFELADKQALTNDEQILLIGTAQRLIELAPQLKGMIDEETGAYIASKEAIDDVVESLKMKQLQEILGEKQKDILQKIVDLELQQSKNQKKYADAKSRQDKRDKEYGETKAKLQAEQNALTAEYAALTEKLNTTGFDTADELNYYYAVEAAIESNKTALSDLSRQYLKAAANDVELIKTNNALQIQLDNLKTDYNNYGIAIQSATTDTEKLVEIITGTPESIDISVNANTSQASSNISSVLAQLDAVRSKTISVNGNTTQIDNAINDLRVRLLNMEMPKINIKALIVTDVDQKAYDDAVDKMGVFGAFSSNLFAPSIKYQALQGFATGGFPEDGLFMANHGELVGQFANGRTAVANNEQITKGISNAVGPAVYDAVLLAMNNSSFGNGDTIVSIDGKEVFRAVKRQAQNYTMQTGRMAF